MAKKTKQQQIEELEQAVVLVLILDAMHEDKPDCVDLAPTTRRQLINVLSPKGEQTLQGDLEKLNQRQRPHAYGVCVLCKAKDVELPGFLLKNRDKRVCDVCTGAHPEIVGTYHIRPLRGEWSGTTCDWGGCGRSATAERYSPTHGWLPVCNVCRPRHHKQSAKQ